MKRVTAIPRAGWRQTAESLGFHFHTIDGEAYWDETAYYQFSLRQIEEDIERPTEELHQMCLELVARAVNSEQLLTQLLIPEQYWDLVRNSWQSKDQHLYGRMDFAYDGHSPARLYEYNADTPTSLYESAFFQWLWLEQMISQGKLPVAADQFNLIQEMLIESLVLLKKRHLKDQPLYLASCRDSEEDFGTVEYFRDCASQAGIDARFIYMDDIGVGDNGQFTDLGDQSIPALFKLYPWEFMFEEQFGTALASAETLFVEPAWKSILSNKAMLPLLWQEHKGHPNLLPSYFENDKNSGELGSSYVRKPVFSREGANISVFQNGRKTDSVDGPYNDSGYILQAYHPVPVFRGNHTLVGSWVVGDRSAGIGIREDRSVITKDSSRFLPHIILDNT